MDEPKTEPEMDLQAELEDIEKQAQLYERLKALNDKPFIPYKPNRAARRAENRMKRHGR